MYTSGYLIAQANHSSDNQGISDLLHNARSTITTIQPITLKILHIQAPIPLIIIIMSLLQDIFLVQIHSLHLIWILPTPRLMSKLDDYLISSEELTLVVALKRPNSPCLHVFIQPRLLALIQSISQLPLQSQNGQQP